MSDQLQFDDRLLNRYTVEDLATSHPTLHAALLAWFDAFADFDDTSIGRLLNARGPAQVEVCKTPAQATLASIPAVAQTLDAVIVQLEAALSAPASPERVRFEGLLEAARGNRTMLVERAPALVAQALSSTGAYEAARAEAAKAVERTVERLETMRTRTEDQSRGYRELQPIVTELATVWSELDRALGALSRQDQRAVRGPHDARMRAAATATCRNLFALKMRDRATGAWPDPAIAPPGDSAPERLAAALARGDYAAAHATLAPWLVREWTVERLATGMQRSAREIAAGFDLAEPPPAGRYEAGSNPMRYEDVRREDGIGAAVPSQVTADNFRGWFPIQIQTDEEDSYLTDMNYLASLYAIAVATPDGERVGHLKFEE